MLPRGEGPSTTLAWSGWKQPDISVEVDTARLETSRTDTVKKLPGNSVQNSPSGSFLSWKGPADRGGGGKIIKNMILCEWDAPETPIFLRTPGLSYPIIVSHLRYNFLCLLLLYSIYLCDCYRVGRGWQRLDGWDRPAPLGSQHQGSPRNLIKIHSFITSIAKEIILTFQCHKIDVWLKKKQKFWGRIHLENFFLQQQNF